MEGKPKGDIKYEFIEETVDTAHMKSMSRKDVCEYIVLYAERK